MHSANFCIQQLSMNFDSNESYNDEAARLVVEKIARKSPAILRIPESRGNATNGISAGRRKNASLQSVLSTHLLQESSGIKMFPRCADRRSDLIAKNFHRSYMQKKIPAGGVKL